MVQNMSCKIYMDHAATTEMLPQVRKAMEPYLMEEYGNASTSYEMGAPHTGGIRRGKRTDCHAD